MTPLRAKMIRELELHRKSPNTIKPYVAAVAQLAGHYHRSPEEISIEEIRDLVVSADALRLGDIAQIDLRTPERNYGRHLDRSFAVGIDVYKEPSANTIEVVDKALERIEEVRELGYPDAFIRMWEYYLCYCEGGFEERAISDVHLLAERPA